MSAPRGVFALLALSLLTAAAGAAILPPGLAAAGIAWPPSSGVLLAEVVTGGASASDEYVEIVNAGSTDEDLGGLELVYVTASGSAVTRKASFATPRPLAPGQHLLVANSAGVYGQLADATYAGGLAADGGAVALRRADGTVLDAVGWGTVANSYVEGAVAPAPPPKSSLERLPGGAGGNGVDTNDNLADWFVQPNPVPQSLASAPGPGPSAAASATATSSAGAGSTEGAPSPGGPATPEPTTPEPTTPEPATPSAGEFTPEPPTPEPPTSSMPVSSATGSASALASTAPATPLPTTAPPAGTPSASPPAIPELETIAAARARPVGARVRVAGLVTVEPGLVGVEGLFAVGDETGGIFVRASASSDGLAVGRGVEIVGTLAAPYGQLEIRDVASLIVGSDGAEPAATFVGLADVGEGREGSLLTIRGAVTSVQTDAGRLTITIGDGATTVRVLADPITGLSKSDVARGDAVLATGIVGQHASATGRLDGYRLWLRRRADLVVAASAYTEPPEPPSKGGVTGAGAGFGAAAAPDPRIVDIGSLAERVGQTVTVAGLVTSTSRAMGASGVMVTVTLDDGTGAVRVGGQSAADALAMLQPGDAVEVTGLVIEDDQGLSIEADPASLVDMPGDRREAPATDAGAVGGLPEDATPGSDAPLSATATVRRIAPGATPLDWVAILAALTVVVALAAAALALAKCARWPGLGRALGQLSPSARAARPGSRETRSSRGEGS